MWSPPPIAASAPDPGCGHLLLLALVPRVLASLTLGFLVSARRRQATPTRAGVAAGGRGGSPRGGAVAWGSAERGAARTPTGGGAVGRGFGPLDDLSSTDESSSDEE